MSLFLKFRQFERSDLGRVLPKDLIDEIGSRLFDVIEELEMERDIHEIERSLLIDLAPDLRNGNIKNYSFRESIYPDLLGLTMGGPPEYDDDHQQQNIYQVIEDDNERKLWRIKESVALLYIMYPFIIESGNIRYPRLYIMKIAYDNNDQYTLNEIKTKKLVDTDMDVLSDMAYDNEDVNEHNLYKPIYDSIYSSLEE